MIRWRRRLCWTIVGALALTLATPLLAQAVTTPGDPGDPCGTTAIFGKVTVSNMRCRSDPNLFEFYSPPAYQMYADYGDPPDPSSIALHGPLNTAANLEFAAATMVGRMAMQLLQIASQASLLDAVDDPNRGAAGRSDQKGPVHNVVDALKAGLYEPLLVILAAVFAFNLLSAYLRGRYQAVATQVALAFLIGGLTSAFVVDPLFVPRLIDNASSEITSAGLQAEISADPQMAAVADSPQYKYGTPLDKGMRLFADDYWRTFLFIPWEEATFEDASIGQKCVTAADVKQSSPNFLGVGLPGGDQNGPKVQAVANPDCQKSGYVGSAADAILAYNTSGQANPEMTKKITKVDGQPDNANNYHDWYLKGNSPTWRVMVGFITLLLAGISGFILGGLAVIALIAQAGEIALVCLAPVVGLLGMTEQGRPLFLTWLRMILSLAVLRPLAIFITGLMLVLNSLLTSATATAQVAESQFWWAPPFLELALLSVIVVFRRPLLHAASGVLHIDSRALNMVHGHRAKQNALPTGSTGGQTQAPTGAAAVPATTQGATGAAAGNGASSPRPTPALVGASNSLGSQIGRGRSGFTAWANTNREEFTGNVKDGIGHGARLVASGGTDASAWVGVGKAGLGNAKLQARVADQVVKGTALAPRNLLRGAQSAAWEATERATGMTTEYSADYRTAKVARERAAGERVQARARAHMPESLVKQRAEEYLKFKAQQAKNQPAAQLQNQDRLLPASNPPRQLPMGPPQPRQLPPGPPGPPARQLPPGRP